MSLEAIVFDLDGVLWNSNSIHESAFKDVLKAASNHKSEFVYADFAGMKTIDVFRDLFPNASLENLDSMCKDKQNLATDRLIKAGDIVSNELHEVLVTLAGKFALGICTSSRRENLRIFLDKTKSEHLFSAMITSEDVTNAKPHPAIYIKVTQELNLLPSQILVIEDSIQGVIAAKQAGNRIAHLCEQSCKINHQGDIFSDVLVINNLKSLLRILNLE